MNCGNRTVTDFLDFNDETIPFPKFKLDRSTADHLLYGSLYKGQFLMKVQLFT